MTSRNTSRDEGINVTEGVTKTAAASNDRKMTQHLSSRDRVFQITEEVIGVAAGNHFGG